MVEQRKLRKSQLINHNQSNFRANSMANSNYNTVQWLRDTQPPPQYPNPYSNGTNSNEGGIDNRAFEVSSHDDNIGMVERQPRQSRVTFS